jgi:hypothetical protein
MHAGSASGSTSNNQILNPSVTASELPYAAIAACDQ